MATVIYNAKVYVERGNFAQAVLVEDGLIRAVGTNEEILAAAPADAERYDAAGRTVVPGFNDSHQHLYSVGTNLESVDVHGVTSIAEVKRITREFIAKHQPAPGSVVYGSGWNQDYFTDEARLLTRQDLDEVSTDLAIVLERACGHILTANTRAIELAGITKASVPVAGGAFDYDADGELTGVFRENACNAFTAIKAEQTVEMVERTLRTAMAHAAECGVTSVQTMDVRPSDWPIMLEAYKRVQQDPTVRVYHQCNFQDPESFQRFLDAGYKTGVGDAVNKIGPLKLFVDGSLGARTALMREPYRDDPATSGIATLTQQEFLTILARIARMLNFHVDDYARLLSSDKELSLSLTASLSAFAPWARESVAVLNWAPQAVLNKHNSTMLHCDLEELSPTAPILREEAAACIYQMLSVTGILTV